MSSQAEKERTFGAASAYVTHTLVLFGVYRALFQSESNARVLDATGGPVFGMIQNVMADDIIRRLAALSDRASHRGGKDKNLSIDGLLEALSLHRSKVPGLQPLLDRFRNATLRAVRYRHKCVGHIDLPTAVGDVPRLPVKLKDILDATECLPELMNAIQLAALNCTTSYSLSYEAEAARIPKQLRCAQRFQTLYLRHHLGKLKGLDLDALFRHVRGSRT